MDRFEQYEIWGLVPGNDSRWQLVAAFRDFEVASAVAARRGRGVRLVHAIYEDGRLTEQQVLAQVGSTRESP